MNLGWEILKEGEYKIKLPILSEEEKALVIELEKRFRELSRLKEFNKENVKSTLKEVLRRICEEENIYLEKEQERYIVEFSYHHIYGLAFIDFLLEDESIEEIAVIGMNKPAYVYIKNKGWLSVNAMFTDEFYFMDIINKMAKTIGRRITLQKPKLDAILPDSSRLHATITPISQGELTIRKFRKKPFSPLEIIKLSTSSPEIMALTSLFMQTDTSLLVAGNTASGKTTTLNALFSFIPNNERILITEETPEINIPHPHQVRLLANQELGISLMDLLYDSLRMRPDRIIVGEIRNKEEALALLDVLLGGQARGAYGTFHAQSSREALQRLRSFGIEEMDLNSIDLILVQRRIGLYNIKEKRIVEVRKIVELSLVENSKAIPLFKFDPVKKTWKQGELKKAFSHLSKLYGVGEEKIKELYKRRVKEILSFPVEFVEFYKTIQKAWFGQDVKELKKAKAKKG